MHYWTHSLLGVLVVSTKRMLCAVSLEWTGMERFYKLAVSEQKLHITEKLHKGVHFSVTN